MVGSIVGRAEKTPLLAIDRFSARCVSHTLCCNALLLVQLMHA
jgi:hypothetical protein